MSSADDRFSQLYIAKGPPSKDSPRARARCAAEFRLYAEGEHGGSRVLATVAYYLDTDLGAELTRPTYANTVARYWSGCPIGDFLDSLTYVHRALSAHMSFATEAWVEFVERVFREESLAYRIDSSGVVHFRVDSEYEANIASAIGALDSAKYAAVRAAFDRARDDLAKSSPDELGAIRNLFEAAESLFKGVTGSGNSLDEGEVKKTLTAFVDRKMKDADPVAKSAAARLAHGFAGWVNAAHPYRHGHDQPAPVVPPLHFAVAIMSTGASYIRWLATLNEI